MPKDSKLFDDFSRLASGAADTLLDAKREIESIVRDKVESIIGKMQFVRREEFEVVRLMVEQARLEQEKLTRKLEELEKKLK